ncbi:MAG: hypothetical protein MK160_14660 [Rhodobacteraceae bacterium]|nr:hypothetical protein [Paracoccaceae bacterium]
MTQHSPIVCNDDILSVTLIDQLAEFEALKPAWDALYMRDPDAHIFLDWALLRRAFEDNPARWSVMVLRGGPDRGLIAALPLKYRIHWSPSKAELQTELAAASDLTGGLYSGLLCDPEYEARALTRLVGALGHMPWITLSLKYCPQVTRIAHLKEHFEKAGCNADADAGRSRSDRKKRTTSKGIILPETLSDFIGNQVQPDQAKDYRIWRATLSQWKSQWLSVSDKKSFDGDMTALRGMLDGKNDARQKAKLEAALPLLETALQTGRLYLPIAWNETKPSGAIVHLHDPVQGTLTRVLDLMPSEVDPALVQRLSLLAIEHAIGLDCVFYDCGRVSSNSVIATPVQREKSATLMVRRTPEDPSLRFDPLCTGLALDRLQSFLETDEKTAALAACKQLAQLLKA